MRPFNAHHAPIGAHAGIKLGAPGGRGGLELESGRPPAHDVLAGVRLDDGSCEALPFFEPRAGEALRPVGEVRRELGPAVDTWHGDGLALRVLSPPGPVPDPAAVPESELRDALVPAVLVELTVDNRSGGFIRRAFFGLRGLAASAGRRGFTVDLGEGRSAGVFSGVGATVSAAESLEAALDGPLGSHGEVAVLRFDVPPGVRRAYAIAVAFWVAASGPGLASSHWYTRLFDGLEDAASYALARFGVLAAAREAGAAELDGGSLSPEQLEEHADTARLASAPNGHGPWHR